MFEIALEAVDGHLVCQPHGDLDAANAAQMRAAFTTLARPAPVVIDLSGVPFLDSAGLGALVGGIRRIREAGGTVTVSTGRASIARVLRTVGFDRVVSLVDTLEDALAMPWEGAGLSVGAAVG
ncbi:MAG: STAS domain-containing protein [Acidimicrobiales bacterium]